MPSFDELDLTESAVQDGGPVLKSGCYLVRTRDPEYKKTGSGKGWQVKVVFEDTGGYGQITENFNVAHSSAEAQRIGREQFKTMLTHGGHPNPDNPGSAKGGISSVGGLELKILVAQRGTYVNKHGEEKPSYEIVRYMPATHPMAVGPTAEPAQSGSKSSGGFDASKSHQRPLDDEIPF